MPAEPLYAKAISSELLRYVNDGSFERSKLMHFDKTMPRSTCGANQESAANETQLGLFDMLGAILTALFFQVLAILLWALESYTGKPIAILVGLESRPKPYVIDRICNNATERTAVTSFRRFDSTFSNATTTIEEEMMPTKQLEMCLQMYPRNTGGDILEQFAAEEHQAMQDLCFRIASATSCGATRQTVDNSSDVAGVTVVGLEATAVQDVQQVQEQDTRDRRGHEG